MKLIIASLMAATMALSTTTWAHGPSKSERGGVVKMANDLSFELVSSSEGVTIYVGDHGKPKATDGATGKVTVLQGKKKSEAPLLPSGGNALLAKGVTLASGSTLVASVTFADKSSATVRFKTH